MFSPFKVPSTIRLGVVDQLAVFYQFVVANYKWSDGVAIDRGTTTKAQNVIHFQK